MNRKYYSTNEKNNYIDLIERYPNIRDALEKLTEDSCFTELTIEEKGLLNMFGFKSIYIEDSIGNLDHIDYNPKSFLGYLYELNTNEYVRVISCLREFLSATMDLLPQYKEMQTFREESWPYVTIHRDQVYEGSLPHHVLFPGLSKVQHQKLRMVAQFISKLSESEFKVFWLMTYTANRCRVVGFKDNILLVKLHNLRLGLFIKQ